MTEHVESMKAAFGRFVPHTKTAREIAATFRELAEAMDKPNTRIKLSHPGVAREVVSELLVSCWFSFGDTSCVYAPEYDWED